MKNYKKFVEEGLKKEIEKDLEDAFLSLIESQMILGEDKVENASYLTNSLGEISFKDEKINQISKRLGEKILLALNKS